MTEKTSDKKFSIIIPAYNPDDSLAKIISELLSHENSKNLELICVINDGSYKKESIKIFKNLPKNKKLKIFNHQQNQGKGAALKTAFKYLTEEKITSLGIVTMDCDGQHQVKDVFAVAKYFLQYPQKMILGVREFNTKIPFRSRFGNILTKYLFRLICKISLIDTQTGLRAIPLKYLKDFLKIKADRYEFEMNVLLQSKRIGLEIAQVKIKTIYLENNKSSNFHPITDSLKIYFSLFSYLFKKNSVNKDG